MYVSGREFTDEVLERIRGAVGREGGELTRSELSRQVCDWLDWRGPDGRAKDVSCRVALLKLERAGVIELPAARAVSFEARAGRRAAPAPPWPAVRGDLASVGQISLVVVNGHKDLSRQWRALMQAHHPLGDGPLCGAQLRYLIHSDRGVLGGLSFSAAAWRLGPRDAWIGWSEATRAARLSRVVNNSRFLILPSIQVPHLASYVLGRATRELAADWEQHYGERPVLVETFVDSSRYRGTCYRAANWTELGLTQGRGRQDQQRRGGQAVKYVVAYALRRDWKKILTAPLPAARLLPVRPAGAAAQDWAEQEFGRCRLNAPLRRRLVSIARDFWARPQSNIPEACGSASKAQAAYRFMDHDDTDFETLLQPHYAATEARLAALPDGAVVLVAQDTTSVNYSWLEGGAGLGPIGTTPDGAQGVHLHSSLALTEQGVPLGFVEAQCWARDAADFGKKARRRSTPIEDKESHRWIRHYQAVSAMQKRLAQHTLISVGDREADIYELFTTVAADPAGAQVLVRARHDRQVLQDEEQASARLFETVCGQPVAGVQHVRLPRQAGRAARDCALAIRFMRLSLAPPHGKADRPAVPISVVLAREEHAPDGAEPIEWLLLSTLPVDSLEQASRTLAWYTQRWGIEVFHRTLKSGCNIEERRLEDGARLQTCLAIDMVVAWRICHMVRLGRDVPQMPCDVYFDEAEWKALVVYHTGKPTPPKAQPPTLHEAIRMVAMIGGFLGRKGDGEPGAETLWRGLQQLDIGAKVWRGMQNFSP